MGKPVKLTVTQAAKVARVQPSTWRAYVARGQAPEPDGHCDPCGCPWWWDVTVDAFMASRPRLSAAAGRSR